MSYYDPMVITLRLSPTFLCKLKDETMWAQLADGIHTIIPDSLLQLATLVLTELAELDPVGVTSCATKNRQPSESDF